MRRRGGSFDPPQPQSHRPRRVAEKTTSTGAHTCARWHTSRVAGRSVRTCAGHPSTCLPAHSECVYFPPKVDLCRLFIHSPVVEVPLPIHTVVV